MQKINDHVAICPSCYDEYQLQKVMEQSLIAAVQVPMPWTTKVRIWAYYLPIPGRAIPLYAFMVTSIIFGIFVAFCLTFINTTAILAHLTDTFDLVYGNFLSIPELSYISKYFPNVSSISDSQISITLITSALLSLFMLIFLQKIIKILLSAIVPVSPNK